MEELIERYKTASGEAALQDDGGGDHRMDPKQETHGAATGNQSAPEGGLRANKHTVKELNALERYLEIWMYNIGSAKMQIMIQEIQALKSKEGMLKADNEILQEKIAEQSGLLDIGSV